MANELVEEMLRAHRERMRELSEMEVRTTAGLAAVHTEVIHDNAQVSVRRSERAKQLIQGIFDDFFNGDSSEDRGGSGGSVGVDADAGGAEDDPA